MKREPAEHTAAAHHAPARILSPREMEVLHLVADGKSTREVARELGISFKTAACHRSNIMAKLEVHETASLIRRAIRWGLIEP